MGAASASDASGRYTNCVQFGVNTLTRASQLGLGRICNKYTSCWSCGIAEHKLGKSTTSSLSSYASFEYNKKMSTHFCKFRKKKESER